MVAISIAVPVFFLLMALELWILRRRGARGYTLQDSLNNLACGIGDQLTGVTAVLLGGALLGLYRFVEQNFALFEWDTGLWWTWVLALVLNDFVYYWLHRATHRFNFLWAGHAVHHQSEEMNLSVALRQSWFVKFFAWPIYMLLPVLGLPLEQFVVTSLIITLYQFWIHTEVVRTIGRPLEWLLNTASHHRVHHGVNPSYIDTNYGGLLIVWDRLFGTFVAEEEEVVYGTVTPLASWNPLWANLVVYRDMVRLAVAAPRWRDKLYVFFAPPEWRPRELGGAVQIPEVSRAERPKYGVNAPRGAAAYVSVHFFLILIPSTLLLAYSKEASGLLAATILFSAFSGLIAIGALLEAKPWARALEAARLVAVTLGAAFSLSGPWALLVLAIALASLVALTQVGAAPRARARRLPEPEPAPRATLAV